MISSLPSSGFIFILLLGAFGFGVLFAHHAKSRHRHRRSQGQSSRRSWWRLRRSAQYAALAGLAWIVGGTLYYRVAVDDGCGAARLAVVAAPVPAATPVAATTPAAPVATPSDSPAPPPVSKPPPPAPRPASSPAPISKPPVLTVFFGRQSTQMEITQEAKTALPLLLAAARQGHRIQVIGFSDNRGHTDMKAKLSLQRAQLLRDWLLTQGLTAQQIVSTESRGDQEPLANNDSPEGRAMNRRAEARVMP